MLKARRTAEERAAEKRILKRLRWGVGWRAGWLNRRTKSICGVRLASGGDREGRGWICCVKQGDLCGYERLRRGLENGMGGDGVDIY